MCSYADYGFYVTKYYGSQLDEDSFTRLALRASDYINYITFGKAEKLKDDDPNMVAVKKCCCALAEQFAAVEKARAAVVSTIRSDGEIQSETVGAHSRTFRSGADTAQTVAATQAELGNIAKRYLLPTGLLYRGGVSGVCPSCCNSL